MVDVVFHQLSFNLGTQTGIPTSERLDTHLDAPLRSALFHMKTRVWVKYFVPDCLCKTPFCFYLVPGPLKLDLFNNFGDSKAFNTVLT